MHNLYHKMSRDRFGARYPGTPTWRFLLCPLHIALEFGEAVLCVSQVGSVGDVLSFLRKNLFTWRQT